MNLFENKREPFCVIIPDRGDNKRFTKFCTKILRDQTIAPQKTYHIDFEPPSGLDDIKIRIWNGIRMAKKDYIKYCYIIEKDIYYPSNYFEKMLFEECEFVGIEQTMYYDLSSKHYVVLNNPNRSALFCTGFQTSALSSFKWPEGILDTKGNPFGIQLWQYATECFSVQLYNTESLKNMPISMRFKLQSIEAPELGKMEYDKDSLWLKSKVNRVAFDFYNKL